MGTLILVPFIVSTWASPIPQNSFPDSYAEGKVLGAEGTGRPRASILHMYGLSIPFWRYDTHTLTCAFVFRSPSLLIFIAVREGPQLSLSFTHFQKYLEVQVSVVHSSVQFSSVAQSCPTLGDPMNRSTPGLPVHHQLPEFTQTHVH